MIDGERAKWTEGIVSKATGSDFAIRNYLEESAVRRFLQLESRRFPISVALDFGAGYGRLTPVLGEFADHVIAVERERDLVAKGAFLQPTVDFREIEGLDRVDLPSKICDFALVFNVMQHLTDTDAQSALKELSRVVSDNGSILLCEDTNPDYVHDDPTIPGSTFTVGRAIESYKTFLPEFILTACEPRIVERTEARADVGTYMLFRRRKRFRSEETCDTPDPNP